MKKIFTLLVLLTMVVGHAFALEFEVDGIKYNGYSYNNGDGTVVSFCDVIANNYSGDITIPVTVEYNDVTYSVLRIGYEAFKDCALLTSVVLPEGVTTINSDAFNGCSSLKSINLPKSLKYLYSQAFYNCSSLTSIEIPEGITNIDYNTFYGCSSLTSVTLPTTLKTIAYSAFDRCSALTSIEIPEGVTSIGYNAFIGCSALSSVTLPSTLTSLGEQAFYGCSSLTAVAIPEGVTDINSHTFHNCTSLKSVTLHNDIKTIKNSAFSSCYALESITLPKNLQLLEDYAFRGCTALKSIVIPDGIAKINSHTFEACFSLESVTLPNNLTSIAESAFNSCHALTSITLPNTLNSIGEGAFFNCKTLKEIVLPEGITKLEGGTFGECSSLAKVSLPESLTTIGCSDNYIYFYYLNSDGTFGSSHYGSNIGAFYYCTSLTSITLPDNLTSIEQSAFDGCSSLSEITIPTNVASIGESAFSGVGFVKFTNTTPPTGINNAYGDLFIVPASALTAYRDACPNRNATSIIGDNVQTVWNLNVTAETNASGVLKAMGAKENDENLYGVLDITLKGTINSYDFMVFKNKFVNLRKLNLKETQVVYSAYEHYTGYHSEDNKFPGYALNGTKIEECILPESITNIGYKAFYCCYKLTEISIPESVETIEGEAFYSSRLKSVKFSEGLENIGYNAFCGCPIKELTFPSTLKIIGGDAFRSCSLVNVNFADGLESIGGSAFANCYSLKKIVLPTSLKTVGWYAFQGCSSLEEIRIPSTIQSVYNYAFDASGVTRVYTYTIEPLETNEEVFASNAFNGTLYVPETAYWNYFYGEGTWKRFQNIATFNEPYEYFYLNKDFTMEEETPRLEGDTTSTGEITPPDADFNPGSGFIVEGDDVQELDSVVVKDDGNGTGGSIIGNGGEGSGNITANKLHINIQITANRWYFFAFPFDIIIGNIKYDGSYVWRYYDGDHRAEHGSGAWKDVTDNKLERGRGYIFQGSVSGTLSLTIEGVEFNSEDWKQPLDNHACDDSHNAGWNFIGNPHTSYFDIQDLGYDHPITVWNGSSYEALNPKDDDHVMHPYEAFFVQKPTGETEINFAADCRQTKTQKDTPSQVAASKQKRLAKSRAKAERWLVNLTIGNGETVADKTRVVFNEKAQAGYEVDCDAAKFMASGVAQLYSIDAQNVKYAINERPTGNGNQQLGFIAPTEGTYTIAVTRADVGVVLKDLLLGTTHDFADGVYTFTSEAGTFDKRFTIAKGEGGTTAIGGVFAAGDAVVSITDCIISASGSETVNVCDLGGASVGTINGNGTLAVAPGVYLITVANKTQKVIVR